VIGMGCPGLLTIAALTLMAPQHHDPRTYRVAVVVAGSAIEVPFDGAKLTAEPVSLEAAEGFRGLLATQLRRYPAAFLRATKLERVVICKALEVGGQHRTASYDREHNVMYYEAVPTKAFSVAVIHHELFHFLDLAITDPGYKDPRWVKLNAPDFHYGQGGAAMYADPKCGLLSTGTPGFLTRYATAALEEDKAETFSHLMVDREYVEAHLATDPVLAAKVQLLGEELHAFCPDVGPTLWQDPTPKEPVELVFE
jgi:hypothetical protein